MSDATAKELAAIREHFAAKNMFSLSPQQIARELARMRGEVRPVHNRRRKRGALMTCPACDGSGSVGVYSDDGSPHPCGECDGEGLVRKRERKK